MARSSGGKAVQRTLASDEKFAKETAPVLGATLTKLLITFTRAIVADEALQGTCVADIY
jgi:hypothetical protein